MLLQADWVLPISGPALTDGAVRVVEGAIGAVGPASDLRARFSKDEVRGFPGCVLLPGLVNVHTHLRFSAFAGFARPRGFGDWLFKLLLAGRRLDSEDWEASAVWGAYECIRSGVTSIADTAIEGWTVARAARRAGLRARVYLEIFGLDDAGLPATLEQMEADLERLRLECEAQGTAASAPRPGAGDAAVAGGAHVGDGAALARDAAVQIAATAPRVEWGISPHAPYTVSTRLCGGGARVPPRAGLHLATHVAESKAEVEALTRGGGPIARAYRAAQLFQGVRWTPPGVSPVQYVAGAGALGPQMLVVHAVQVDAGDISTLAGSGAAVAHCPRSNLHLRCGSAPVAEMREAGIAVGLGTDSLASNDSLDMFSEMRAALRVGRERAAAATGITQGTAEVAAPTALTPADALYMATLGGARALGWDHLTGSLEVGKRADIIAARLPAGSSIDALVAGTGAADVVMTMVDGTTVFEGGEPPGDVVALLDKARVKLGLEPLENR